MGVALSSNAIFKAATVVGVSIAISTKQTLYTVPSGKSFVPTHAILRNVNGNAAAAVVNFGANANADDWLATLACTNLSASGAAVEAGKVNHATLPATKVYPAGDVFGIRFSTTAAFTCDVDLFGYLI